MGIFSILPESLRTAELWISRACLLFALLLIGPWLFLIIYDILLYIWRTATYEIPVVGGRARGKQRPRAPSLTERPSGTKRRLSVISQPRPDVHSAAMVDPTGRQRNSEDTTPRVPSRLRSSD
ncbi:hypothetical protein Slin15195_G088900 [Septoria linicola]|uniref:Uncharacterized protein n=1 Tax=Septoria linicola TaxID=215465 RepID=A0A9Q9B3C2_9PEZI|nr:hypothetical protein Slin14017_G091560 [Septoria linicola]USW55571.1 hypothetical protein Slin15195_G088900 [Septoria linicola]